MVKKKYDIFLSYRRDGGYETAHVIKEKLERKGYSVFFDIESLRSGLFNEQLFDVIDHCKDFILILPPNGLDRCHSEGDWVRKEVLHALEKKKNIIPVMLSGFEWPDNMPKGLEKLPLFQSVTPLPIEYSEQRVAKIIDYLKSKPSRNKLVRTLVAVVLVFLALDFCAGELLKLYYAKEYQREASEIIHKYIRANEMIDVMREANGAYQVANKLFQENGDTTIIYKEFRKNLVKYDQRMKELGVSQTPYKCQHPFAMQLRGFTAEDLEFIHGELFDGVYDSYVNWSKAIKASLHYYPDATTSAMSSVYGDILVYNVNLFEAASMKIFSLLGKEAKEQWYDVSPSLLNLSGYIKFGDKEDVYDGIFDTEMERIDNAMNELEKFIALVEQSYISQDAMNEVERTSREAMGEVRERAENVARKSEYVLEQRALLDSLNEKTLKEYQKLKEKCYFTVQDGKWGKWGKVNLLASALEKNIINMQKYGNFMETDGISSQTIFSDISLLLDVFAAQYPDDRLIVEAARAFYKEWLSGNYIGSGVIVWMTKDNLPHPVLCPGDIVLQRQKVEAVHVSDITQIASGLEDDSVIFLRLENGFLVKHTEQWQKSDVLVAYSDLRQ